MFGVGAHGADEARTSVALQRERRQENRSCRARRAARRSSPRRARRRQRRRTDASYVPPGNPIPRAWRTDGMRAVAAGDVRGLDTFRSRHPDRFRSRATPDPRPPRSRRARSRVRPRRRRRPSRSINSRSCSSCGKISAYGIRTDARAHVAEARRVPTCLPAAQRLTARHSPSARDHRIGETDLAVQLERACLHGQRARRRARLLASCRRSARARPAASATAPTRGRSVLLRRSGPRCRCITARFSVPGARGCRLE